MGCCADQQQNEEGNNLQFVPSQEPNRLNNEEDQQFGVGDNPSTLLKRPDLKGTFSCLLCRKQFCHSSSLSRHKMQTHFRRFRCTICNKQISSTLTVPTRHIFALSKNNMTNERPNPFLLAVQFQQQGQNSIFDKPEEEKMLKNEEEMDGENAMMKTDIGGEKWTEKRKKKPYKELTLEEKVELIRLAERCTNLSQANIAEKYEIAKSNVCRILQRKEEYIRALESAGFSGSRKRKLRTLGPEEEKNSEIHRNQERLVATKGEIGGLKKEGKKEQTLDVKIGSEIAVEEDNEALRSHMASEHQNGRVFLCRCCNWAFQNKNELHRHLKSRRSKEQPKVVEEPPKSFQNSAPEAKSNGFSCNRPSSPFPSSADRHQHLLMANLWNNILLGQNRIIREMRTAGNGEDGLMGRIFEMSDDGTQFPHQLAPTNHQPVPSSPLPISSSSSSSVIVQNGAANVVAQSSQQQTGLSPSESSDIELTIISNSSSSSSSASYSFSSSSHNNCNAISPSQSCSSSSIKNVNVPLIEQICPPSTSPPECPKCALMKPKLALIQTRCSYLEIYNGTLQNELVRLNAKCILAEQCIRRLELDLRQWRERNDLLRYRLLECREKALSMIQTGGGINGAAYLELNKFVGEMLKITLI